MRPATFRALRELALAEGYSADYLPPTSVALACATALLLQVSEPFSGSIGAIGDGGLVVRWLFGERDVSLTVPPDGTAHVYAASGGTDWLKCATPEVLQGALRGLLEDVPIIVVDRVPLTGEQRRALTTGVRCLR